MTTDDTAVIKQIRRKVNGRTKSAKAPRAASWSLSAIEALAGKIDFTELYARCDAATLHRLFLIAATQQLKDFVQQQRTSVRGRAALTEEELVKAIKAWAPSTRQRGKSNLQKASKFIAAMNAAERADLIAAMEAEERADFREMLARHD